MPFGLLSSLGMLHSSLFTVILSNLTGVSVIKLPQTLYSQMTVTFNSTFRSPLQCHFFMWPYLRLDAFAFILGLQSVTMWKRMDEDRLLATNIY